MASSALCPPSHHLEAQAIMITHRINLASKRRLRDWEGITLTSHWLEGWCYREPAALNGYPGPVQRDCPRQLDLLHGRKPFVGDGRPRPEWRLNMAYPESGSALPEQKLISWVIFKHPGNVCP